MRRCLDGERRWCGGCPPLAAACRLRQRRQAKPSGPESLVAPDRRAGEFEGGSERGPVHLTGEGVHKDLHADDDATTMATGAPLSHAGAAAMAPTLDLLLRMCCVVRKHAASVVTVQRWSFPAPGSSSGTADARRGAHMSRPARLRALNAR
eukprot:362159-Chlamydomonas_euryale.AAC.22